MEKNSYRIKNKGLNINIVLENRSNNDLVIWPGNQEDFQKLLRYFEEGGIDVASFNGHSLMLLTSGPSDFRKIISYFEDEFHLEIETLEKAQDRAEETKHYLYDPKD